jgi:cbb3-type cytochrome oxidase subunit 3
LHKTYNFFILSQVYFLIFIIAMVWRVYRDHQNSSNLQQRRKRLLEGDIPQQQQPSSAQARQEGPSG